MSPIQVRLRLYSYDYDFSQAPIKYFHEKSKFSSRKNIFLSCQKTKCWFSLARKLNVKIHITMQRTINFSLNLVLLRLYFKSRC